MNYRHPLVPLFGLIIALLTMSPNFLSPVTSRGAAPSEASGTGTRSMFLPFVAKEYSPVVISKAHGMNFSPYTRLDHDPNLGARVSENQVRELVARVAPYTEWVRTYGVTNGLEYVPRIARQSGLKVAAGAWLMNDTAYGAMNEEQIANLISIGRAGDADILIVGSETLHRRDLTAEKLINYIARVRQAVPGVPVATADTYDKLLANPAVIAAGDVVLPNYYPHWDGVSVDNAIANLNQKHQRVLVAAGGKQVIVSETGWPSAGDRIGQAILSPENARKFFLSFVAWARAGNVAYYYFEAFDEPWKVRYEGVQGAYYGIWDENGNMKPGLIDVFAGLSS